MMEHFNKSDKCAKYTLNHNAKKLESAWSTEYRVLASRLEFYIKKLNKNQKETLIKNNEYLSKYLNDKVDCSKYNSIKVEDKK